MKHGQFPIMAGSDPTLDADPAMESADYQTKSYALIFGSALDPWSTLGERTDEVVKKLFRAIWDMRADPAGDNTAIPAGYTYFGQLVTHDITQFLLTQGGHGPGSYRDGASNLSTPALDLDCIYGGGPERDFVLYQPAGSNRHRYLFRTGKTSEPKLGCETHSEYGGPDDIPRITEDSAGISGSAGGAGKTPATIPHTGDPLIADARNDDHLIISQLHLVFIHLHNKCAQLIVDRGHSTKVAFETARRFVTQCYCDVVKFDYAKRILCRPVFEDFCKDEPEFVRFPDASPLHMQANLLPLEFTLAAGRFGHAMVRPNYPLNACVESKGDQSLNQVLDFSGFSDPTSAGLRARMPLPSDWVVDWSRFFPLSDASTVIPSRRINPFFTYQLANRRLPQADASDWRIGHVDHMRSLQLRLPSGQDFARALQAHAGDRLHVEILRAEEFDMGALRHGQDRKVNERVNAVLDENSGLKTSTPLLFYILLESAVRCGGLNLGPVGSFIVGLTLKRGLPRESNSLRHKVEDMAELFKILNMKDKDEFIKIIKNTIDFKF